MHYKSADWALVATCSPGVDAARKLVSFAAAKVNGCGLNRPGISGDLVL
jgi:hypothetical protein